MKYTQKEAKYFYWHCTIAALLIESLTERNAATSSHFQRAIRMASETAVGKAGAKFASEAAHKLKPATREQWSGLGLTREHVIPVSVIAKRVLDKHDSGASHTWRELVEDRLTQDDLQHWKVTRSAAFLDLPAPLSAVIANEVRGSAIIAWITKEEDKKLKEKGLTKRMPSSGDEDPLARYKHCKIRVVALDQTGKPSDPSPPDGSA